MPKPIMNLAAMNNGMFCDAVIIVAPTMEITQPIWMDLLLPKNSAHYIFHMHPNAPPAAYTPLMAPRIRFVSGVPIVRPMYAYHDGWPMRAADIEEA
jgi:hypothetical protein